MKLNLDCITDKEDRYEDEDSEGQNKRYWLQQATRYYQIGRDFVHKYHHSASTLSTMVDPHVNVNVKISGGGCSGCRNGESWCDLLKPAIESLMKAVSIRESQLGRYHVATYEAYDLLRKILVLYAKLMSCCNDAEEGIFNYEEPQYGDEHEEENYNEALTQSMLLATSLLVIRIHIYLYPSISGQLAYPYLPGDVLSWIESAVVVVAPSHVDGNYDAAEKRRESIVEIFQESIQLERLGDSKRVQGDLAGAIADYRLAIRCEQEHLVKAYDDDGGDCFDGIINNPSVAYLYRKIACIARVLRLDDLNLSCNTAGLAPHVLAGINWTKLDRIKSLPTEQPAGENKMSGASNGFASFDRHVLNHIDQDRAICFGDELSIKFQFGFAASQYQLAFNSVVNSKHEMAGLSQVPTMNHPRIFAIGDTVKHGRSNCFKFLDLLLKTPTTSGITSTRPTNWNHVKQKASHQDYNENWPTDENDFNIARTSNVMGVDSVWTVNQDATATEYDIPQVQPTLVPSSTSPMTRMVNQMEELSGKLHQAMSRIVDLETKYSVRDDLDVEEFPEPPSLLSCSNTTVNCRTNSVAHKRKRSRVTESQSSIPDDVTLSISHSDIETIESSLLDVKSTTATRKDEQHCATVNDKFLGVSGNGEDDSSGSFLLIEKWDDDHLTHIIRSDVTAEYEASLERINHELAAAATETLLQWQRQLRHEEGRHVDCADGGCSSDDNADEDGWVGC